jgi:hypothetical protein
LRLRPDECLDAFLSGQSQAPQLAFSLPIDVKIEEWAALSFGSHPIRQLCQRHAGWTELEFVPSVHFHNLRSHGDQPVG